MLILVYKCLPKVEPFVLLAVIIGGIVKIKRSFHIAFDIARGLFCG